MNEKLGVSGQDWNSFAEYSGYLEGMYQEYNSVC